MVRRERDGGELFTQCFIRSRKPAARWEVRILRAAINSRDAEMSKHLFSALAVLAIVTLSALGVVLLPNATVQRVHQAAAEQVREGQGKSLPADELAGAVVGVALIR